jgi:hypothetical protein
MTTESDTLLEIRRRMARQTLDLAALLGTDAVIGLLMGAAITVHRHEHGDEGTAEFLEALAADLRNGKAEIVIQ